LPYFFNLLVESFGPTYFALAFMRLKVLYENMKEIVVKDEKDCICQQ